MLRHVVGCLMLSLATAACADAQDDRRRLAYLSDTVTTKEPAAISAYRAKNGSVAAREFEELVRLYSAIVDIKTLSDVDRRYWEYALLLAEGRLANAYRWSGDEKKSRESIERAMRHSRTALNKPLTSPGEVEHFIEGVDRSLGKP